MVRTLLSALQGAPLSKLGAARLVVAAVVLFGFPRLALAEHPLQGKWSMSPMSESFTVQQWVSGCGPAPVSGSAGGGGGVTIIPEGDELVISGSRVFRTNQCWDTMPTLVRQTHSRAPTGRSWSTRCATPAADPRHADVTTNINALSDTQISIVETGRYEINLADGKCVADVRRSSFLSRPNPSAPASASASTAPPVATSAPSPTTPPAPVPTADCSTPGEPARLEVRPSEKLLRTGESFTFKASVRDASGCPVATPTTWVLEGALRGVTVDATGKVSVAEGAAEGSSAIIVTAAGKSARVTLRIASPARYDELLAQSGLDSAGEKAEPAIAILATGSIGATTTKAEDSAQRRRLIFISVVAGIILILGVVAIIGIARSRKAARLEREAEERHEERLRQFESRKQERQEQHAAQMKAHLESVAKAQEVQAKAKAPHRGEMVCPSCRREYPAESAFCPHDANRLIPVAGHEEVLTGPSGGICPVCKRGFNPGVKVCPHDNEELIPYAMHASRSGAGAVALAARGKICPTCGGRFDGSAAFCGKDGTALVLLN